MSRRKGPMPTHYSNPLLALLPPPPPPPSTVAAAASIPPDLGLAAYLRAQETACGLCWSTANGCNAGDRCQERNANPPSPPAPQSPPEGTWPCSWCQGRRYPHRGWCPTRVTEEQWVDLDRRRFASKRRAKPEPCGRG